MMSLRQSTDAVNSHTTAGRSSPVGKIAREKDKNGVGNKAALNNKRFCQELIRTGLNAKAAYLRIHPNVTPKTAEVNGHRMLRNAKVRETLEPMLEGLFREAEIDAKYVFRRWREISQASPLDYFDINIDGSLGALNLSDLTPAQRLNLREIKVHKTQYGQTVTVRVLDQQHALDMIAKHLGLLTAKKSEADNKRIGDLIELGVKRIRETKDLDGWRDIELNTERYETG